MRKILEGVVASGQPKQAADASWSNVKLLLRMNGAADGTVFTDISPVARTISKTGTVVTNQTVKKYGNASARFSPISYLSTSSSSDFDVTVSAFTLEFWVYFNVLTGIPHIVVVGSGLNSRVNIQLYQGLLRFWTTTASGNGADRIIGTSTITSSVWYHVALVKNGSQFQLFVGGVSQGVTTTSIVPTGNNGVYIGHQAFLSFASDSVDGYIDEFRFTKNVARYASNFTPPAAEFPNY